MEWKIESTNNRFLTCESTAIEKEQLVVDIETVLNKIISEKIIDAKQILFYINATNGYIVITGYSSETEETFDESGIWIELRNLWENEQNAYDFDEFVLSSIKKAFKTKLGEQTKKNYQVFYKTEEDDVEKIK